MSFETDVKPVLDGRCVVCHGCYDAPCQLLLSSHEGAARGASKQAVYDTTRLTEMEPTRLGVDAHGTEAWRAKGFFSVLESAGAAGSVPLLARMLALGAAHPPAPRERLPASVPLDVDRTLSCADAIEFDAYARDNPHGGMPYGTAPLADEELRILASWVAQGAPAPAAAPPPARDADVDVWEAFLNGPSLKERIAARYLYEHWFVAHLVFEGRPAGPFFRVVRSRTAPGEPIDEIATVRPFDDPGATFWYRLRPIDETIVHKTHIVYALGPARLARLRQLFLETDWQPTRFPSYVPQE
ncbi:MAG: fatty acid cis/trans isomerase, partial [Myxococcota bacterium]